MRPRDVDGRPQPHGDRLLVALEAGEDDAPDTPAAPALLDYADGLGEVVRVGDNEWIALPDAWVVNAHRSAATSS
ncbi:hypothetical protein ACFY2R_19670 [Micromonospora olivasterospora]|uniref:Uncharacterized protein n=1 Tax=Micromonospora olivasterospora TaxID=1880 RepID=A0A562IGP1_MICOL|nr:hypothetical protein [Micromonospora olivasterospora]TWH69986.1 hypothetical protein JD77_05004 [Micromonospora olivasterospora]